MKEKILKLLDEIKELKNMNPEDTSLPGNVYFLNENDILCTERQFGDSRYPYTMDGLVLWTHSTGHINASEGNFTIFRKSEFFEESNIEFWGGIKIENNWFPVSITGASKQLYEPIEVKRYLVFGISSAYYIAQTPDVIFALRANVTSEKQLNFTVSAINLTNQNVEVYLSSYFQPMLRYMNTDNFWGYMTRFGKRCKNGNTILWNESDKTNYAVFNRQVVSSEIPVIEETVGKNIFMGALGRGIMNAEPLKTGKFEKNVSSVNTTDFHVMGDIIKFNTKPVEEVYVNYLIDLTTDADVASKIADTTYDLKLVETDISEQEKSEIKQLSNLKLQFNDIKDNSVSAVIFNRFLKTVQKQVDLCALGKSYAGNMLGVRDVFQQMDAALIWNAGAVRKKIIMALNHIFDNGRTPRQFSVSNSEQIVPNFDTREYIDQGLWVIGSLYKYISFTNDKSILKEECFYYEIIDEEKRVFKKTDYTDTVVEHLIRITDYLVRNIDDRTNCLKILFGDWNDALNGLGASQNGNGFGSGVSVMATLQLYSSLQQMSEILNHIEGYVEKSNEYKAVKEKVKDGLLKYAVEEDDGSKHIIHGWGDNGSYKIGTTCDGDGKCRYSSTVNAFWCLSTMIENNPEIKKDLVNAFKKLDSKYGIKTIVPEFEKDMYGVGNICKITPGTYENSCSYVHATMFSIMALYSVGESEFAWEQLKKAIPVTHNEVTKTPFVMPNSYCYNEEYQMDGQSMGDWYTGSGATVMRTIVEFVMGVQAELDGIKIMPASYIPTDKLKAGFAIKESNVSYIYRNEKLGERKFIVNGKQMDSKVDIISSCPYIYISNDELLKDTFIEIID